MEENGIMWLAHVTMALRKLPLRWEPTSARAGLAGSSGLLCPGACPSCRETAVPASLLFEEKVGLCWPPDA